VVFLGEYFLKGEGTVIILLGLAVIAFGGLLISIRGRGQNAA